MRNYRCSLCFEKDFRVNLICPCNCQENNKKNEDSGFVHKHCLEELLRRHQADIELGEAPPKCPQCRTTYDVELTASFRPQWSSLLSLSSWWRLCEVVFFLLLLGLCLLILAGSAFSDMATHPVVGLAFLLGGVRVALAMCDQVVWRTVKSWLLINSHLQVQSSTRS